MAANPMMIVRIAADVSELKRNLAEGKFQIEALGPSIAKLQATWQKHSERLVQDAHNITAAVAQIGAKTLTAGDSARALKTLEAAMAQLRAAGQPIPPLMAQTASELQKLHAPAKAATSALSGVAAQVTGLVSVGALIGFGRQILQAGDRLTKMADQTSMSAEQVQRLGYIAGQSGLQVESLVGAAQNLQQRLGDDTTGAAGAMAKLRIHTDSFNKLGTYDQMLLLGASIGAIRDPTEQASLAAALFGKTWKEIMPALKADMASLAEQAPVMSNATVASLDRIGDALERMKGQATAWGGALVLAIEGAGFALGNYLSQFDLAHWGVTNAQLLQRQMELYDPEGIRAARARVKPPVLQGTQGAQVPALDWAAATAAAARLDEQLEKVQQRAEELAKIADHMYGRDALKQLETWAAAIGGVKKIAGLAPAIQDEWRAAVEKAEKALGKMTPELRKFADALPLITQAISLRGGVTGWPVTDWEALANQYFPPLEARKLPTAGVQVGYPGVYTGNMRAGVLKAGQEAQRATTTFTGALDDLSRAFAELAQVADGDMAKAVRAIGTMITTMQVASQAAASTRGILWNAETGTWQAPQGAGQYAQLAANTVAMYAAMQQATSSTSRAQNIWSGAGTGAQIGGGIMPGWGHLIGAGIGALWGGLSRAPEQAAKDLRDAYIQSAGGLAELNKQAVAAGSGLEMLLRQTDVEGVQWHIDNINRQLAEFAKRLQDAVIPLARISAKGGLLGPFEIQALVRDAITPEIRVALESFFVSETQRGISGIAQIVAQTPAVTAKSAPGLAGAVVAYWAGMEAQGLSLLQMLDSLGPTIATLQEKFAAAGVSGGAAFDAIAKIVTNTLDPAVRAALESATGYNAVLETLFNTGQLTQEIYGGLAAGLTEQYDELIRQGVPITEAARLLQRPLQTVWQLQQQYKWVLDAGTQALLDRAIEAGLVGEQFRPAADRMVSAIDSLILTLQTLTSAILGQSGAEAPPSEPGEGTAITRPGLRGINPPPWEAWPWWGAELPPVEGWEAHAGGLITAQGIRPWVTAHGGALLGALDRSYALMARLPRAHGGLTLTSDEVPFIGLRGERVLSREQTRAYDRGQTAGSLPPIQIVVKTYLDGRQIAEAVVPEIPAVVRRYGLS